MLFRVLFHTFYTQFKGAFLVSASLTSVCYDTVVYYIRAPFHKLYILGGFHGLVLHLMLHGLAEKRKARFI